ncbi:hypothetical protein B0H13DRAFT_1714906, partial [Mycena leptocephala]
NRDNALPSSLLEDDIPRNIILPRKLSRCPRNGHCGGLSLCRHKRKISVERS